ncbi:MAG: DNA/RNA non-specific endonuclease [Carboxylicivirga sp.]|jgi:endonuclease G|nr:DNA/RNA non-specific endonuclease [Carboxylicivirga sp.]
MQKVEVNVFFLIALLFISASLNCQIKYSPNENFPSGEVHHYLDFSLSYSENHEQPLWVSYQLTQEELMVKRPRKDFFKADKNISTKSASLHDYKNSGYDRGHIVRASFCKSTDEGYKQTYLLSNMSPQKPNINRVGKIWYRIEDAEMYFAYALDSIYAASGPIFKDNIGRIGTNNVTIPGYYYKAVLSKDYGKAIGFIIPHEPSSKNVFEFAVSINLLEEETGIDFFHQLPNNIENDIEEDLDLEFWEKCYSLGKKEKKDPLNFVANDSALPDRLTIPNQTFPGKLQVISWNVESGGATKETVVSIIKDIEKRYGKIDIWGFSEVQNESWIASFRKSLGEDYWYQLGTTGHSDRLGIIYNRSVFSQVGTLLEFHDINPNGNVRSPIALKLMHTESGQEILFMVNHLYRGDKKGRQTQAQKLNEWIQQIDLPVIAVGDYNFDFDISSQQGNKAFDIFIEDDHFTWVKPQTLISTQCNKNFNSILDFIFINDDGRLIWKYPESEIFVQPNDCDKSKYKPDHRPIYANFK